MIRTLASLASLMTAASLVNLANSTMTTVMALRMQEDGASDTVIALFGSIFFLGFVLGCFTQPPVIQRIGYIRAFAAAAGLCTILMITMDRSNSLTAWLVLRFFMGVSIATVFAAVDGWINGTSTEAMRSKVFATYGWCLGASAVVSQLLLIWFDGLAVGFLTMLALAFNLALVLVAMTRSTAPLARSNTDAKAGRGPVFTSGLSVGTSIYVGLVTTAILAILPTTLAEGGLEEAEIGVVIGAFFLGRLLLQIPLGIIADRVDMRLLVATIAGLIVLVSCAGALLFLLAETSLLPVTGIRRVLVLPVMVLLGGLIMPLYAVANSLAFARAEGRSTVRIATSLLMVNSIGAVAGPLLVALATPALGPLALALVVILASVFLVVLSVRSSKEPALLAPRVSLSPLPTTSVASTVTAATAKATSAQPPACAAPQSEAPQEGGSACDAMNHANADDQAI